MLCAADAALVREMQRWQPDTPSVSCQAASVLSNEGRLWFVHMRVIYFVYFLQSTIIAHELLYKYTLFET